MDLMQTGYVLALFLCAGYASIIGGRTGRIGSAIFLTATGLTALATLYDPAWDSTAYAVFAVDGAFYWPWRYWHYTAPGSGRSGQLGSRP